MKYKSDIHENCPRHLERLPTEPCPIALRTIDAIANGASEDDPELCPWYVPDVDSCNCFWSLLDREAPVENTKDIARMLGMSKQETEKLLASAIAKLTELGVKSKLVVDWIDTMQECDKPLDDSIYLKLFDTDAYYDPSVDDVSSDKSAWNPEDVNEDYRVDTADFKMADRVVPNKRREALKHITRGHVGAGAVHYKGDKIQLYALSPKWKDNAKKFAEAGTGIKLATYTLERVSSKKATENDDKSEPSQSSKKTC